MVSVSGWFEIGEGFSSRCGVDGALVDVLEVPTKCFKGLDVWSEPEVVGVRKLVTTPEPERIISFFRLRITPISYIACCSLHWHILTHLIIFNFVNLMRSCHLVLMNKRKCDDDDDDDSGSSGLLKRNTLTYYRYTRCSKGEIRLCYLCLFLLKFVSDNRLCL